MDTAEWPTSRYERRLSDFSKIPSVPIEDERLYGTNYKKERNAKQVTLYLADRKRLFLASCSWPSDAAENAHRHMPSI